MTTETLLIIVLVLVGLSTFLRHCVEKVDSVSFRVNFKNQPVGEKDCPFRIENN